MKSTSVTARYMKTTVTELCSVTDVLGNLTAVRVLDLSHNELTQLPAAVFSPPRNLTALYLQHNLLTVLPLAELISLKPQLRIVDVRANRLQHFHHELMPLVENGTRLLYSGKLQDRYATGTSDNISIPNIQMD
jgi:Leucine-rich repeat (LRR) protein